MELTHDPEERERGGDGGVCACFFYLIMQQLSFTYSNLLFGYNLKLKCVITPNIQLAKKNKQSYQDETAVQLYL